MAEGPGEPNQGAFTGAPPSGDQVAGGPPPDDAGPAAAGAPLNQGATGAGPEGEGAAYDYGGGSNGGDAFAERPELFVGAAFAGGFALAMLLKRLGS